MGLLTSPLANKMFVDELSRPDASPMDLIAEEPVLLDEPWMNVALAAIAEFVANSHAQEPPKWTESPSRFLEKPIFLASTQRRVRSCWQKLQARFVEGTCLQERCGCTASDGKEQAKNDPNTGRTQ